VHVTERTPLTAYQSDVWAAHALRPDLPQFNNCGYQRFTGPLDVDLLRTCLYRAVARHDALRLRFDEDAGRPYQWAVAEDRPDIALVDLSGEPDPRAACLAWIERAHQRPFAVRRNRLYELGLLRESDEVTYGYLVAHHLVTDGWGGQLFLRDVLRDYEYAQRTGEPREATAPSYLAAAELGYAGREADVAYYREALAGHEPALFARTVDGGGHRTVSVELERALLDRIRALGGTTFTYLAAALGTYLSRVHRSDRVVLGVPFLNRRTAARRRTVGHFANELPMVVPAGGELTMRQLAAEIHQTTRTLRHHERLSRGDLLRALPAGTRALYDVTLSYLHWSEPATVAGVRQETFVRAHAHERDALAVTVTEIGDDGPARVDLQYAPDVFDADFPAGALARHLETLLRNAVDAPDVPLCRLSMLGAEERAHLTDGLNDTAVAYLEATLTELVADRVAEAPDRPAVVGANSLTYGQLVAAADRVAGRLRAAGAGRDDRVAVLVPRGTALVVAILGVLRAGAAYVPIDPGHPAERIRYLLRDSGARVVLVAGELPAGCRVDGVTVQHVDSGDAGETAGPGPAAGDLAYVIYTSGSTGEPKGVAVEHRSVVNRLRWMQRRYPLGADDVLLLKTPVSFDVSVWELFWWAISGARLAVAPPGAERDPAQLLGTVARHRVSVVHFVPSMLGPFLDLLESSPAACAHAGSLRLVVCSGEELPAHRVEQFNRVFAGPDAPRLANLYGPTEATVDVAAYDCPTEPPVRRVPIGRPIDNVRLYVLGRHDEPQPAGAPGELCVGGVAVARGYLGRPELTAERFGTDPFAPGGRLYRTGDLARRLADGTLEYLGRVDDQVKVRGNRVEPGEVRAVLATAPGVRDAAVVARTSARRGTHLVGYCLADADLDPTALRAHLSASLPEYMMPAFFVRLDRLPVTGNGKLDRTALPDPEAARPAGRDGEQPRDEVEATLAAIWTDVLGTPPAGVHEDYFAAGGDSILALRICAEAGCAVRWPTWWRTRPWRNWPPR
jgi:amino acid adenylation domain-containing protein